MEFVGDRVGLQFQKQVRASLEAHQCSIEHGTKSINLWFESMAKIVSLAWASYQPHHSNKYTIGPYQASKHVLDFNQWGIQFGSLTFKGLNIFGKCIDHDCLYAISSKAN
jgi:hypothetical protein